MTPAKPGYRFAKPARDSLLPNALPLGVRTNTSTREAIAEELEGLPEADLGKLLAFLRLLKEGHAETEVPMLAAESALSKDWLTPEEDAAWASL